jgi:outer membrane protein TolC
MAPNKAVGQSQDRETAEHAIDDRLDGDEPAARYAPAWALGLLLFVGMPMLAQGQEGGNAIPASTAAQLPLSSRPQAGVTTQQASQPVGASSMNVITPSLQIQVPYSGSVRDPTAADEIRLSLPEAIRRGLQFNLGEVNASFAVRQTRAQRGSALSELLPHASMSVSETGAKEDLQTEGLGAGTFGNLGLSIPVTVGPYHYYSLQGNLSANALDLTSLYNYRSASMNANASALTARDARELVILAVAGSYMQILHTRAQALAQTDQVRYAQALYDQARAQSEAGTKAEIDALRILVQLQTEQQRLRSEESDLRKQSFAFARLIGLPVNARITFTSILNEDAAYPLGVEQAVQQALARRQDLKAQEAQVRAAEATVKAARAEHMPTASIQGYYGLQGINPDQGRSVFSATAKISVPVFAGGRIHGDVEQAKAVLDQRRAELDDQRGAVEQQVRSACDDLDVATTQVQVAKSNRELALKILKQSQDRFASGATDSVEVIQSQQTLGAAFDDYVSALYAVNLARISLARAMGDAEQQIPALLKDM